MATPTSERESLLGLALSAALTVADLERSVAWYRDVAGFAIDRQHERDGKLMAVSLRAGDVRLLLGQDDGSRGAGRVKGEGFSLQITTDQDVDEIAKRMKEHGAALDLEPVDTPWGERVFRFRDPDGFRFAISSARNPARRQDRNS
jgi:uncharacterized glyoxalase superfamily protein PhnB